MRTDSTAHRHNTVVQALLLGAEVDVQDVLALPRSTLLLYMARWKRAGAGVQVAGKGRVHVRYTSAPLSIADLEQHAAPEPAPAAEPAPAPVEDVSAEPRPIGAALALPTFGPLTKTGSK